MKIKNKRLSVVIACVSYLLAAFQIVGNDINKNMALNLDKSKIILSVTKFIIYVIILYVVLMFAYKTLDKYCAERKKINKTKIKIYWMFYCIIFILWLPYYINYFPGIFTSDTVDQMAQGLGKLTLSNHHPVFHTLLISATLKIGQAFSSIELGVGIFSFIQMLISIALFSSILYYMYRKGTNNYLIYLYCTFIAVYPVIPFYSITIWKDVPFGLSIMMITFYLYKMIIEKDFWSNKKNIILLFVCFMLAILLKNNGIYITIITIMAMFIFQKNYRKKVACLGIGIIVFYLVYNFIVFNIFNIKKGSIREALSIPLQQFARIERDRYDDLSETEIYQIYKFLPVDNLGDLYNPIISDPVKMYFDDNAFEDNKIEFIKLWMQLVIKFPKESIESFLCNSYGYWYPETTYWVISNVNSCDLYGIQINGSNTKKIQIIDNIYNEIANRDLSGLSMLFSIGTWVWLYIICLGYCIYKKEYNKILVYIPIFSLWLTSIASPVYCEFRYMYGFIISMLIIINTINREKDE